MLCFPISARLDSALQTLYLHKSRALLAWWGSIREANLVKRLNTIVFIFLLTTPLLLAQDSQSDNSPPANAGGACQISCQGRNGYSTSRAAIPLLALRSERHGSVARVRMSSSDIEC